MKFFFKVVVFFLIVFNFRLPIVYNSVAIAAILASIYYVFIRKSIPFSYFFFRYNTIILAATILLTLITLSFTIAHDEFSVLFTKRCLVMLSMLLALVYVLPLLIEGNEKTAYEEAAFILCYAFALQGAIHLTGFLVPPVGDFLFDMKPEGTKAAILDPSANIDKFRAYALTGSIFFELPSAYGVACIMFLRIQLMEDQQYITSYKSYAIFFLLIIGICLSGRTGFVGIALGLVWYLFFAYNKLGAIFKTGVRVLAGYVVLLCAFYLFLSPKQQASFVDDLFPFAFEMYYNYVDEGQLRTASTDVTMKNFYYPLEDKTLLYGDGVGSREHQFYKGTDAGYMNALIYGGIPYLLVLLVYQALYFIQPVSVAYKRNTRENMIDLSCFVLLYIYMLILEYKDTALGTQHLTEVIFLFLGSCYLIKYYENQEESENEN
ncbi:MAG: hypothetical protein FWF52_10235 [Candidatus Azobacteroides sp.]|nr:hypothetical protein [Candidatus Azobacteroides sp.]